MANYLKMCAILYKAIGSVIDPLNRIPLATPYASVLENALLETEDVFCETAEESDLSDES